MFTFPSFRQVQSAGLHPVTESYFPHLAYAFLHMAPQSFVPTIIPELNEVIKQLNTPVIYDVPKMEENQQQDFPFTNNKTRIIHMPHPDAFKSPTDYTHVLLHELSHWTAVLLKRPGWNGRLNFDMENYAFEELVAELTAMGFEQAILGRLLTEDESMSYLRSYAEAPAVMPGMEMFAVMMDKPVRTDPMKRFDMAVGHAQKAVEFLLSNVRQTA